MTFDWFVTQNLGKCIGRGKGRQDQHREREEAQGPGPYIRYEAGPVKTACVWWQIRTFIFLRTVCPWCGFLTEVCSAI